MAYLSLPILVAQGGTGSTTASGAQTNLGVPASTAVMLLNGTQAMTASLNAGSNTIINVSSPVNGTDAANKTYVDSAVSGIRWVGVRVATTGSNISLSGGAPNTLDGVSLNVNDIILVKDQSTQSQNGIYSVSTVGSGSNGTWARATNFTTSANYATSINAFVDEGTTNGDTFWLLPIDPDNPPTLGTTALVFVEFSGGTSYSPGNGISISGGVISAVAGNSTITVNSSGIEVSSTYSGNTSLVTLGTVTTGTWQGTSVGVGYGGTGSTTASGARSNLAAAPNTAVYYIGTSNGELGNAVIPSVTTGLTLTASTGVFGVDTTVVATTTNTLTMSNKTLTSPVINDPQINREITYKTSSYTVANTDDFVKFNISSGANATMTAHTNVSNGQTWTIKNAAGSTANVTVLTNGTDKLEGSASGTYTLYPGDSIDVLWDNNIPEYTIY